MFSRIGPPAFKHDLTNTLTLCHELGNPHLKFKSIHIAGTNGKGSVSHMLAAVLQTAGYKTGLYTSPHLKDFRERIRINGEMISEEEVINFTERIKPLISKIEPSFFEITVAMAFNYFAGQEVDIAVIETGLGGRLDSTNIITPELSIITNIGWDHMNMLGDTLEKIAFEKAGIIKPGVPVVIGEVLEETQPVFEKVAAEKKSLLTIASMKRQVVDWEWEKQHLIVEVSEVHHTDHKKYELDLPGLYQTKNLLTVLEACNQLQQAGWNIENKFINKGLKLAKKITGLQGRWDIVHRDPSVIIDVAHNVDGMQQLIKQVEVTDHLHLHIILGMVRDKEIDKILALMPKQASYYFTKPQVPRAIPETDLYTKAVKAGLKGARWPHVNDAIQEALQHAEPKDLIIICGSVFLAGDVTFSFS
jgi:dihydrofolate synthase/folylpolyglutamate synthase